MRGRVYCFGEGGGGLVEFLDLGYGSNGVLLAW